MISKKTITGKSHDHSPDNKGQCVKCDRLLSLEEHVNWYCKKYSVKIPLTRPLKPTTGLLVPSRSTAKSGFAGYSKAEIMKLCKDFMEDNDVKTAMEEIVKKRRAEIKEASKFYGVSESEAGILPAINYKEVYKKHLESMVSPDDFKKAYLSEFAEELTENIVSHPKTGTLSKKPL